MIVISVSYCYYLSLIVNDLFVLIGLSFLLKQIDLCEAGVKPEMSSYFQF